MKRIGWIVLLTATGMILLVVTGCGPSGPTAGDDASPIDRATNTAEPTEPPAATATTEATEEATATPMTTSTPPADMPQLTETYTNTQLGYTIDYPSDWYTDVTDNGNLFITSFEMSEAGQGGIPSGETKIDVLPPAAPDLNQPLDEMVTQLEEQATEVLWTEEWTLPGGVPAVRIQSRSQMSGEVAHLLTRIRDTSIRMSGYGDLTLFDPIARTLQPLIDTTPTPAAGGTGTVTGQVCYPSEEIPAMTAYFEDTASGDATAVDISRNQSSYSVDLPAGEYLAYAWLPGMELGGSYSEAVPCGLTADCEDHSLLPFTVEAGMTVQNIDLCDWYGGPEVIPTPPTAEQPAPQISEVQIYLVALEDAGQSGQEIGCGDSIIPVNLEIEPTAAPLTAALEQLLAIDERLYGQSGLYNALYQSDLSIEEVAVRDGTATISLIGDLALGGTCDNPRVEAQLKQTALQFSTVDEVDVFISGQPLDDILSGQ